VHDVRRDDDESPPPGGWNDGFGEEGRTPEEQDRAAEGRPEPRDDDERGEHRDDDADR
jgi:hypothetical protein